MPTKHHVLRRYNDGDTQQELTSISWGPQVENAHGELVDRTVALVFESDESGTSMELYTINM